MPRQMFFLILDTLNETLLHIECPVAPGLNTSCEKLLPTLDVLSVR